MVYEVRDVDSNLFRYFTCSSVNSLRRLEIFICINDLLDAVDLAPLSQLETITLHVWNSEEEAEYMPDDYDCLAQWMTTIPSSVRLLRLPPR